MSAALVDNRLQDPIQERGEGGDRGRQSPPWLAEDGGIVHTPSMTVKNAAMLALIGTILVTALLAFDLIRNVLNVVRGLVPAVTLFSSLIYAFGAFSVAVFFFVFHKAQS
jgi:hypothetical protein